MNTTSKTNYYITNIYLVVLSLVILFGRSFTGIYIGSFRVGEFMIAFCLILSLLFLISPHRTRLSPTGMATFYFHKLIIISFFSSVFLTKTSFFQTYTYQSSSYIWTLVFLNIGIFFTKNIELKSWFFKLIPFLLPLLYILSTILFPEVLQNFFLNYSDKFDFVKASDLLVVYVGTNYILRIIYKRSLIDFSYFIISSAIYIPFLLFKSKGAFFPAVIFILFNLIFYISFAKRNKLKTVTLLFLAVPVFFISTFHIYGNFSFTKIGQDGYSQDDISVSSQIQESITGLVSQKNTGDIFYSFYILDGRLYSQEQMANWRLQIWQDITRDLFWEANYYQDENFYLVRQQGERRNDIFFSGFGYKEILPSMNHWERTGTDGTNQNPHNFLFNSLGRGGVFQPILIILFHISIFIYWFKKYRNLNILLFMLPVLMTSFFDASMESVRFPFVYYSFLGIILNNKI